MKPIDKLPERFLERCQEIFGNYYFNNIQKTFVRRPVVFRVNTLLSSKNEVCQELKKTGFKLKPVFWYDSAFLLENKSQKDLEKTSFYQTGKIYLQSLASMVPPVVLDPQPQEKVLDLASAPGGKTSEMASIMKGEGELWAVEIDQVRFAKLTHNMTLLGVDKIPGFLNLFFGDGVKFCLEHQNYFDKILLDAPCGAEARIISEEKRSWGFWKEKKIKDTAYLQRKLLLSAWSALKPGGTLVYSTCTFAPEENEEQIDRLLKKFPGKAQVLPVSLKGLPGVSPVLDWKSEKYDLEIKNTFRILPTKEIEGFFVAKIKKSE